MPLSKCDKLKTGQLLMQRYKLVYDRTRGTQYASKGDVCKEKSMVLARKMVAHATQCRVCSPSDDNFYGLDDWE